MIRFRLSFLRADQGINELVVNEFELTRALNSYVDEHGPARLIEVKESATENYHVEAGPYGAEMDAVAGTRRWRRMEGSDSAWVEVSAEGDPKPGDWNLMIIEPPHPRSLYEQTRMDRDLADAKLGVRKKEAGYEDERPHGSQTPRESKSRTINGRMELVNPDGTFPTVLLERFGEEELRRAVEEERRPPEPPRRKGGFSRYFGISIKLK